MRSVLSGAEMNANGENKRSATTSRVNSLSVFIPPPLSSSSSQESTSSNAAITTIPKYLALIFMSKNSFNFAIHSQAALSQHVPCFHVLKNRTLNGRAGRRLGESDSQWF